jgi:tetratricopeptide (TPR) repeat protein
MAVKVKCAHCKHKAPKKVCGCDASPFHNEQVEPNHSCEQFAPNPAQPILSQALAEYVVAGDDEAMRSDVAEQLETAIRLGLPEDEEAYARYTLGEICWTRGYRRKDGGDISRGVQEMEKALLIDAEGHYGVFAEPLKNALLGYAAAGYLSVKDSVLKQEGIDPAIAYLQEKIRLFAYLPNPPLLILQGLGELYVKKGDIDAARRTFTSILQIPAKPTDSEHESNTRDAVKHQLEALGSQRKEKSGCFIATAVYGSEECVEVERLRRFRDSCLMTTGVGRLLVRFYYVVSPPIARLLSRSSAGRCIVREFVLRPLLRMLNR